MHIDDAGGRFAKTRPSLTVGSKPTVDYPGDKLPAWVTDRGPDEPPLGFSVDAMEPVGESFEVLQSAMQANANVPTSEPAQQEPGAAIASPGSPFNSVSGTSALTDRADDPQAPAAPGRPPEYNSAEMGVSSADKATRVPTLLHVVERVSPTPFRRRI
jgi:hypothetical protein